jgi:hypothetical protein
MAIEQNEFLSAKKNPSSISAKEVLNCGSSA